MFAWFVETTHKSHHFKLLSKYDYFCTASTINGEICVLSKSEETRFHGRAG